MKKSRVPTMIFLALITTALALSRQCGENNQGECPDGTFCVGTKFCLNDSYESESAVLFVAGTASMFVSYNDVQEADCVMKIEAEIDTFIEALEYWSQGDYVESGAKLLTAVENMQSSIATCVSAADEGSFWDELWDAFKYVVDGLCAECGAVISEAEYVIQGVDILDDWAIMIEDCVSSSTPDQFIACGEAFGDAVKRIAAEARASSKLRIE